MAGSFREKGDGATVLLAEGEAALWLSESLILALLEAKILDAEAILEAIDIVIAAKKAKAEEGVNPEVSRAAASQLALISASIATTEAGMVTGGKRGRRIRSKHSG